MEIYSTCYLIALFQALAGGNYSPPLIYQWTSGELVRDNISQVLVGLSLSPKAQILWSNAAKAFLLEL